MIDDRQIISELERGRSDRGLLNVLFNSCIRYHKFRPGVVEKLHLCTNIEAEALRGAIVGAEYAVQDVSTEEERRSGIIRLLATSQPGTLTFMWSPAEGHYSLRFRTTSGHDWYAMRPVDVLFLEKELLHLDADCRRWLEELPALRQRIEQWRHKLDEGRKTLFRLYTEWLDDPILHFACMEFSKHEYNARLTIPTDSGQPLRVYLDASLGSDVLSSSTPRIKAALAALNRCSKLDLSIGFIRYLR